jgi:hypothetical protein
MATAAFYTAATDLCTAATMDVSLSSSTRSMGVSSAAVRPTRTDSSRSSPSRIGKLCTQADAAAVPARPTRDQVDARQSLTEFIVNFPGDLARSSSRTR